MQNNLDIFNYFASPIGCSKLNFDLKEIETFCYHTKMIQEDGRNKSNRDGWQSLDLKFPNQITYVAQTITDACKSYYEAIGGDIKKYNIRLDNMWINLNPKNGYNITHTHPHAFVSGVFYVKTPPKCGRIYFKHPCTYLEYDWRDTHFLKDTNDNRPYRFLNTEANNLYIFPGWLEHGVEPNKSDEDRISLSFNVQLYENE